MNVAAIIQARMGSSRLPGKVMMPILNQPLLSLIIQRVQESTQVNEVIVATSREKKDDPIAHLVDQKRSVKLWRGSEEDVLARFYEAAVAYQVDIILRITADNPFFHAETADKLIKMVRQECDFSANNIVRTYPYGLDLEVFSFKALATANLNADEPYQREHVSPYIRSHPELFRQCGLKLDEDYSDCRLTVDTKDDYLRAKSLFEQFGEDVQYTDVVEWEKQNLL